MIRKAALWGHTDRPPVENGVQGSVVDLVILWKTWLARRAEREPEHDLQMTAMQ
jgi:hypothetical protein